MKLEVNLGGFTLQNPVITASGTYGFGEEYSEYIDLNKIGGITSKGLTLKKKLGNPPPRIMETESGIMNSVGLQNPGVEEFLKHHLPFYKNNFTSAIIANVAGNTIEEYCEIVEKVSSSSVDAIEVNISCPNVKHGGLAFGASCDSVTEVTKQVRKYAKKPLIIKLSPNVTSISEIAKAAEAEGADSVSLVNTFLGMKINIKTKKPVFKNNYAGLSGPAIKPIALRMVNQVYQAVKIPVIGMGGIETAEDALEFILAGATSVSVGTANFMNPYAPIEILEGIQKYLEDNNIDDINDLIGAVELY